MNAKFLFSTILFLVAVNGCDNIFSSDDEKTAKITVNSSVINPGRAYEFSVQFKNPPSGGEIEWNCDKGYLISGISEKTVSWVAPKEKTICKIECRSYTADQEEKVKLEVMTENKKPILKNTEAFLETRYIYVRTEVWDDDNTTYEISYNFDCDSTLIVNGYGNLIEDDHNFVFLGFGIPWDENFELIPGVYSVTLRVFDFVDTLENKYNFTVPAP